MFTADLGMSDAEADEARDESGDGNAEQAVARGRPAAAGKPLATWKQAAAGKPTARGRSNSRGKQQRQEGRS